MDIAFFDFDGTITKGDSFRLFLRFALGKEYYVKLMQNLHILLAYKLSVISNHKAKEYVFRSCFRGMHQGVFEKKCNDFLDILLPYCKQSALDEIQRHKNSGATVVIVSASFESYLKPLCDKMGIDLLATRVEVVDRRLTGRFKGANCYGIEKVNRIHGKYTLDKYDTVFAYGDTIGDKEMLELGHKTFYRYFT